MIALGILVVTCTGLVLITVLDTFVYHESWGTAIFRLWKDYKPIPFFMIAIALLLALWEDVRKRRSASAHRTMQRQDGD